MVRMIMMIMILLSSLSWCLVNDAKHDGAWTLSCTLDALKAKCFLFRVGDPVVNADVMIIMFSKSEWWLIEWSLDCCSKHCNDHPDQVTEKYLTKANKYVRLKDFIFQRVSKSNVVCHCTRSVQPHSLCEKSVLSSSPDIVWVGWVTGWADAKILVCDSSWIFTVVPFVMDVNSCKRLFARQSMSRFR